MGVDDDLELRMHINGQTLETLVESSNGNQEKDADPPEALVRLLRPSLPPVTFDRAQFRENGLKSIQSFVPPGRLVEAYSSGSSHFEIYSCALQHPNMKSLYERLQTLALWFIEGADFIDLEDDKWTIFTLYEKQSSSSSSSGNGQYRVAGYISRYTFITPIIRGTNGSQPLSHRICQVLLLPPYQRQGHASRIVSLIMKEARDTPSVYNVTVEDPVPAFSRLRTIVDCQSCLDQRVFKNKDQRLLDFPLSHAAMEDVRRSLKLDADQMIKCFEILKLRQLKHETSLTSEARLKSYRLNVKRRLYRHSREQIDDMDAFHTKAFLETQFQAVLQHYESILSKLGGTSEAP